MANQNGLDPLLEALRQSGVNVDDLTGGASDADEGGTSDGKAADTETGGSKSGSGGRSRRSSGAGAGRGRQANPFGGLGTLFGIPGFNMGDMGDEDSEDTGSGGGGGKIPRVTVETSLGDRVAEWSKRTLTIAIIVVIIVLLVAYWWFHPPISINSVDTWLFVAIFILLPLFIFFSGKSRAYRKGTKKVEASLGKSKAFKFASYIPVIVIVLGLVGALLSLSLFPGNAAKYANVLQTQQLDFAQDIQEVNYSEIPVIDHDSAVLLGNREMGTIPDYVSQFEVDDLYSQINYKGTPVRVSPLGYADLFKWFTNRGEGIPAYAIVDMTTQDASIVRLSSVGLEGMKYTPSEPLARNIDRYVQLKHPFYIFDEKAFEIDEDGHPWWICPVRTYTIGLFGGETIRRVVLCDAVTGETQDLAIEDVPSWVDRAYPSSLLIRQYNWSGAYIHGWFNSWLGQEGVYQTTPGTDGNLGFNYIAKDDDVWVYTGVTSATADNSIIGFVLINQRTAESHFYSVAGATEDSAMRSAEGQVQNLRYTATFPLLINVANQPTYFMALKDAAGLVKQFAMIDIRRYQNVAVGDTVAACQKSYETLLATNGVMTETGGSSSLAIVEKTGTIRTMAQAVIEGNTHFYITLEGDSAIYDIVLPGLIEIVGYQPGDQITFTCIESGMLSTVNEIMRESDVQERDGTSAAPGESASGGAASASAEAASAGASAAAGSTASVSASASAAAA